MPFPVAAAIGAGVSLVGMGIAAGKDKRQLRQQKKLQDLQIAGNKEMMEEQYKMWERTGYGAQKEQMKKAGLNPALLYGLGGGGGQSMGSPGSVTGGQAAQGSGNEFETMAGMGIQVAQQIQLMKAQKENIEADTANKRAEAGYTGGVKTENTAASTGAVKEETKTKELTNKFLEGSMTDRLSAVSSEAVQEIQRAQQMVNDTNVSDATIQDRIKQIQQNAIGQVLDNALMRIEQTNKQVNIEKARAEIKAIAAYVEQGWQRTRQGQAQTQQGWDKVNIDKNRNEIMERLGNAGLDLQDRGQILQTITGIMGAGANIMPRTTNNSWWSEDSKGNWNQGHSSSQK